MSGTRRYILGLSTGYVATLAGVGVSLILTPFVLGIVDRERYALFALCMDVLTWLNLVDLGIGGGLQLHAARMSGKPEGERLRGLVATAVWAQAGLVIVVGVLGLGLAALFPSFFRLSPALWSEARLVMVVLLAGTMTALGTKSFFSLLVAFQQIHVDNLIRLLNLTIRTALTVVLLLAGVGIVSLAIAHVVAVAVTSSLAIFRTYRTIPGLSVRPVHAARRWLRELFGVSLWVSLGGLVVIVTYSLDRVVAARVISVESVAVLYLTGRVYQLAQGMLAEITNTARPALAQMLGRGDRSGALRSYRRVARLSTAAGIVGALSLWSANGAFVPAWVGAANYGGLGLDTALALNLMVFMAVLPARATLAAALRLRWATLPFLVEAPLNLGLALLLVRRWGLAGIAVSTTVAASLVSLWILPLLLARHFQERPAGMVLSVYGRPALIAAGLVPLAILCRRGALQLGGMIGAIGGAGLVASAGAGMCAWVLFGSVERTALVAQLRGALRRPPGGIVAGVEGGGAPPADGGRGSEVS